MDIRRLKIKSFAADTVLNFHKLRVSIKPNVIYTAPMNRYTFILAAFAFLAACHTAPSIKPAPALSGNYVLDPAHASITWSLSHAGLSNYTARFDDIKRKVTQTPEMLSVNDIDNLKSFMQGALENETLFNQFIGAFLTQAHHPLELLIPVNPILDDQLDDILAEEDNLFTPVSGIKALIIGENTQTLFISGESFQLDENTKELGRVLAKGYSMTTKQAKSFTNCLKNRQLLTSVLNKGFWFIE